MDNASYHSIRQKGTKPPTSATRKAEMQEWLNKNNINFDIRSIKPKLYNIKQNKPDPVYEIDELLKRNGHNVVRLPPYLCASNPLSWYGVIWNVENSSFKVKDVYNHIKININKINQSKWFNACIHVENKVEETNWKVGGMEKSTLENRVLNNLDSETDSQSDSESESDSDSGPD